MRRATPSLTLRSVQFQQVGEHLIDIAFPFGNVGNGENGIDAVVAAGIDGFDKKAVDLKNAEDVSVFDDALREANAVVPHVGRLLIEGKPIESIEFHSGKDVVVQCLFPLRNGIAQGFNRRHIHVYFVVMTPDSRLHLVECPRDAIQGWPHPITTEDKLAYYRTLLRVGFDTLDMGSFVSPKAMPAMADTGKVLAQLEEEGIWDQTDTRALVIVANERGARDAVEFESVSDLGFPLSISPTFQERNTRASIDEAWRRLNIVSNLCAKSGKELVVYLSMGFGNPYGDDWNEDMPAMWASELQKRLSPSVISVADTIGAADPELVERVFSRVVTEVGHEIVGAHLHIHPMEGLEKIKAAHRGGCFRMDGALRGVGGCPMAQDDLVGNAPTEWIVEWARKSGLWQPVQPQALDQALSLAADLFA